MIRTKKVLQGDPNDKVFIGIDNGVSGTIGIIYGNDSMFLDTPTFSQQSYTKKKQNITRVNVVQLAQLFKPYQGKNVMVLIERPLVNPTKFKSTLSAIRALEATLNVIEMLGFAYDYIDSREWQKVLLPKGSKGEELKKDSVTIGCRLFPHHEAFIKKHKDADGILIAEYCRRKFK